MGILEIMSHDGLDRISIQVIGQRLVTANDLIRLRCSFYGASYVRESSVVGESLSSSTREDYEIHLPQLIVGLSKLQSILAGINEWQKTRALFEIKLADLHEQQAVFSLQLPTDFICNAEEPVVIFSYSVHKIAMEARFKSYASSLNKFAVDLAELLGSFSSGVV